MSPPASSLRLISGHTEGGVERTASTIRLNSLPCVVVNDHRSTPVPLAAGDRSGKIPDHEAFETPVPSRPFLESHVRRRLRAIANVTVLDGHDVVELTTTADRTRVTGARLANRDGGNNWAVTADLRPGDDPSPGVRDLWMRPL